MTITSDFLREHDACEDQVLIFEAEWPDGAELTLDNLLRAAELGLDIWWLALTVLHISTRARFCSSVHPAYEKYGRDTRCATKAFTLSSKGGTQEYIAFKEAIAPHKIVLNTAIAHALMEALEQEAAGREEANRELGNYRNQ